jgi:hypothetical protein
MCNQAGLMLSKPIKAGPKKGSEVNATNDVSLLGYCG